MRDVGLAGVLAVLDYTVLASTRFAIAVILARQIQPAEFGAFVLAYALLTVFNSLQVGIAAEPLIVVGAPSDRARLGRYVGAGTLLVIGLAGACALGSAVTVSLWLRQGSALSEVFRVTGVVALPVLLQDFFRRIQYVRHKSLHALINSLLFCFLQGAGLFVVWMYSRLTASSALWVIGASAGIAALWGMIQTQNMLGSGVAWYFLRGGSALRELWEYARWSLSTQVAFNISTHGYLFGAGFLIGPFASGIMRACQNLVAPIQLLLLGAENYLMALASKRYEREGVVSLKSFLWFVGLGLGAFTLAYVVTVNVFATPLLTWLYRGQYAEYPELIALYGVYYLGLAASRPFALGLRSIRHPVGIFRAYMIAMILLGVLLIPLTRSYGIWGAVAGESFTMVIVFLVVAVTFIYQVRLRSSPGGSLEARA